MFKKNDFNWISLLLSISIAVVISWTATGCRFGNYVDKVENPDRYSGFYLTEPHSFSYLVATDTTQVKPADLDLIPEEVGQYITNPVALVIQDLSSGKAVLTSPEFLSLKSIPSFPTRVRSDDTIFYQGTATSSTFWKDPNCVTTMKVKETGSLTYASGLVPPPGTTRSVSGRMSLTIQVLTLITGDCTTTLQDIANCYQDETLCGEATASQNKDIHDVIKSIFDPYIESQALSASDLTKLTYYGYEVSYQ